MTNNKIQPVIILGAGRSGTKFLRNTLLVSEETCSIPYDVNYIWRTGNEGHPDDELPVELLDDKKIQTIRSTFFKMSGADTGKYRIMLEKTVGNTLRVPFVKKVFPEAKFVHLIRDGRAVTESAIRLWEASPESGYLLKKLRYFPLGNYRYAFSYALNMVSGLLFSRRGQKTWGPLYKNIAHDIANGKPLIEVCAKQWSRCVIKTTNDLLKLDQGEVHTIRYEDLMTSDKALRDLCDFIQFSDTKKIIKHFNENKKENSIEKWREKLTEEQIDFLNKQLQIPLEKYLYSTQ